LKGIELLMLSSGTTGVSKAISLSLDNILSNTRSIQKYIIPTREDRCLIIKEITHSSSLISELINSLLSKNSVLLSDLIPTVSSLGYLISTY
ncbi:AMP-binding protein, partial [Streptococcus pneumoniae]|nr:AMP-binding protein [Streptococcus pneumoniae]